MSITKSILQILELIKESKHNPDIKLEMLVHCIEDICKKALRGIHKSHK